MAGGDFLASEALKQPRRHYLWKYCFASEKILAAVLQNVLDLHALLGDLPKISNYNFLHFAWMRNLSFDFYGSWMDHHLLHQ